MRMYSASGLIGCLALFSIFAACSDGSQSPNCVGSNCEAGEPDVEDAGAEDIPTMETPRDTADPSNLEDTTEDTPMMELPRDVEPSDLTDIFEEDTPDEDTNPDATDNIYNEDVSNNSENDVPSEIECLEGQLACENECVDSNINNCGACATNCAVGCDGGECDQVVLVKSEINYRLALTSDGRVFAWGRSDYLGVPYDEDGPFVTITPPVQIPRLINIVDIDTASNYSCAVTEGGRLFCWGRDCNGAFIEGLGNDCGRNFQIPQLINRFEYLISDVTVDNIKTCVLLRDGTVHCWDDGSPSRHIQELIDIRKIASANNRHCALDEEGSVFCWGGSYNGNGEGGRAPIPVKIENIGVTSKLVLSNSHTCTLSTEGRVFCWGIGPIGVDLFYSLRPIEVEGLGNVIQISSGEDHMCALILDGSVYCWGEGGLLGNGLQTRSSTPVQVIGMDAAILISSGPIWNYAIQGDERTFWRWRATLERRTW